MIEFSPQQHAAVTSDAPRVVIRASAGAGKTRVIVGRFLRAVMEERLGVEQILTATFTNKAAAEMKLRITAALREAGYVREAQGAQGGPIQTLHSFCERVLRANACEVPMDPDFAVLPPSKAQEWMFDALGDAVRTAYNDETSLERVLEELAGVREYASDSPHGRIEVWAEQCLKEFRGSTVTLEALSSWSADAAAYSQHALSEFSDWLRSETGVVVAPEPGFFSTARQALKTSGLGFPNLSPAQAEIADATWPGLCDHAASLLRIVVATWRHWEDRMVREAQLDFAYLESACLRLLQTHTDLAQRLRDQYPVVLIDEAQDLNPVQFALLDALNPKSLTLVGDPSQSIYSFRQAAPHLFRQFAETAEVLSLTVNYRSSPNLIRTLDAVYRERWPEHAPMEAAGRSGLINPAVEVWDFPHADWRQVGMEVLRLGDDFAWNEVAILVRRGKVGVEIASRLSEMAIPCRLEGISETFYSTLEVSDLANLLEALVDPSDRFALACLQRSPFVGMSLAGVVQVAAHSSGVTGLEAPEGLSAIDLKKWQAFYSWFSDLSRRSADLPAWELIAQALGQSPYLETVANRPSRQQTLANVRKLQQLACQQIGMGAVDFAQNIRTIQRLKHREMAADASDPDAPAVRIMTMHTAKGLEFPCVILPDAYGRLVPRAQALTIERSRGLAIPVIEEGHKNIRSMMTALAKPAILREEERVLYVAMTRAEQKLCVIGSQALAEGTPGRMVWEMFSSPGLEPLPVAWRAAPTPSFDRP